MGVQEVAFERLDLIWGLYPRFKLPSHSERIPLDLPDHIFNIGLAVSSIEPLAVRLQDTSRPIEYVDVADDIFVDKDGTVEEFTANSQSIHPMIDCRPIELSGIEGASVIYAATRLYKGLSIISFRQCILAWQDENSGEKRAAAGFVLAKSGPVPLTVRMYPNLMHRHLAILDPLLNTNN